MAGVSDSMLTHEQIERRLAMLETMLARAHPKDLPYLSTAIKRLLDLQRDLGRKRMQTGGFDDGLDSQVHPHSIQFHQHVIPLNLDGKAPHPVLRWRSQHLSGFDVELGTVPGACDDLACQFALP